MYKKIFSLALIFAMILSITSFGASMDTETTITICHTNDIHSRVVEGKYDGMGLAKVAKKVEMLKDENPNFLLFDSGDAVHGQTIATLVKGESIIDIFNIMGYDGMVAGNHDFNYGKDRLLELDAKANFPILGANVLKEDGTPFLNEYFIKEINGIKIGVFGLSTPETLYKTHPDNVVGLTFEDPSITAKRIVKELEGKVDIIICLSHLGLDKDSIYRSDILAENTPEIDIIVDGHSHHVLEEGLLVNGVLIAQAGEYDKNLGIINFTVKNKKIVSKEAKLFTKKDAADLEEQIDVANEIAKIQLEQEKITSVIIGKSNLVLDGERADSRSRETNLGNLITNAMISETGADIAITNGGGIRASVDIGDITMGEIITVLPFGNYIVTKDMKGSDIRLSIEHGISAYPELLGAFPHVAGLSFKFDPMKEVGSKIISIYSNGKPLEMDKIYTVATNDFLAAGGDDYSTFKNYPIKGEYPALDETLISYIQKYSAVSNVENRIVPVKGKSYTVKNGDLLWKIAKNHGSTWQIISKYNNLENPNLIMPGQEIILPIN